jgi:superfamily I DNA/RNA helicase
MRAFEHTASYSVAPMNCPEDLIVLAGPGSGKTRHLIELALAKCRKGRKVAIATYTNAAANEIKERLKVWRETEGVFVGTAHALAATNLDPD